MMHSLPATRANTDCLETKLCEAMKGYRKLLQKVARMKTKVLYALRDEGVREAAELLQTPACEVDATRCNTCVGCTTWASIGQCGLCTDCRKGNECSEHTRLCFSFRQPATTFVVGSEVTGMSSLCNIVEYDLGKYRSLLDQLGEASVDIEEVLDDFPVEATQHKNDMFNASRRTRDIENEEERFMVIESLLNQYQNEWVRLHDVLSDGEDDGVDDTVDISLNQPEGFGLLTHTLTYYPFSDTDHSINPGRLVGEEGPELQSLGLGLGLSNPQGDEV